MHIDMFLDTIEDYLVKNNITTNQLAKNIGISSSTITRWKNNQTLPSIKDVKIISNHLGLSCDYMFGLSENNIANNNNTPFALCLGNLMANNNITAYKLAKECNFQKAAVSKWLNGQREPRILNVIEIALHFDCSIDSII